MRPLYWFLLSLALLVGGVGMMLVPHVGPEPSYTCVEEGQPSSGFAIEIDGQECLLSPGDFQAYWHYERESALPVRRAGLGLFVVGLGLGVTGIVSAARRSRRSASAAPAAA
ncbi:hypothetical protein [Actinomyces howellii]|uniref:Uncharacterized protein n=1 Tax=Actinomyces howellii TaxID=52771 RepID=A0A3S4V670_9ACTO|nr:hypothetical protein [Actinomyces howellii]VEG29877.1 Uncharacterised protein [Actinomyces howellii]